MKRLVLVDGNALLHRAYHATPPLTTPKGELINAVYGFTLMLLKAWEDLKPDFLTVAWDTKAPTLRHLQFTEYKAQRVPADRALTNQYDRVFEILAAFSIPSLKLAGFEADDLIGALAKQAKRKEKRMEIIVLTGDRDIMQLIDDGIKVLMPKKTLADVGLYGVEEFVARFGFLPKNLVDFKALAGDPSDNIPGVKGVGEVTATKLIQQYGPVEKIYQNLPKLPEKLRKLLKEGEESALLSKKLATLETDIPIRLDLATCRVRDFDREKVRKLFEELEFKSLLGKIPGMELSTAGRLPASTQRLASTLARGEPSTAKSGSRQTEVNPSTADLDHQVEPILKKMSKVGVLVDLKFLGQLSYDLKEKLTHIEQEIYSDVGHRLNINSPKQLSGVLFDELKLPVIKKIKTGRSTDEETLLQLQDAHPAVPLILQYRQLFKLISTYVDALPKYAGEGGRIHSTFNVEGAATGRLSSQNPNLQNIPIKGELGSEIRKAFIVPKDKILLGADYSQIELRILAHLADDPGLKKAFGERIDIHVATAAKIFNVPLNQVTKKQRMAGKTVNFATLYGQGPHALSRQLGVDYSIARQYIEEYFAQFPKVREWMSKVLAQGVERGYVETLWGRRRYIPELTSNDRRIKAAGERAAVNHPIQGSAADMIKKAMVGIDKELSCESWDVGHEKDKKNSRLKTQDSCRLILQVHDELLFECDPKMVEEVGKMVKEKMEQALTLSVPVVVDLKMGKNWGEMSPLVKV